ncbi:MAG: hypothetical protein LUH40_01735 [Clostridiales bacterium]|nr:hypothetical protein [Clostridiales bacterium]
MKKTHEYDSPALSRLVSVVTVLAICICSLCTALTCYRMSTITVATSSGTSSDSSSSTSSNSGSNTTTSSGGNTSSDSNAASSDTNGTSSEGDATASEGDGTADVGDSTEGYTNEQILAKYTEVMNQLKSGVATYEKKEFQTLSDDYDLGTIGNLVLPIAQGLMTSEDEAELQQRDDAAQIPIIKCDSGCMLTDVSAIKSASMTESGGKTTIVITLNDEVGSLPAGEGATSCSSTVGSMFNPLDQASIDNIVEQFSAVLTVNSFTLTYQDCTATLVFDTATGQVESLNQIMNVRIDADAKVTILSISGYAYLINNMTISNVTYA